MARKKQAPKATGSTRMALLGHKPCQLWLSPLEMKILRAAAEKYGRPLATYIREVALTHAKTKTDAIYEA